VGSLTAEDLDKMDRIRSRLYSFVSDNPDGEDAAKARELLARMPKVNVGPADIKPDENPSGPLVKLPGEHSMIEAKIPGLEVPESATALDVMDPRTKGLQALDSLDTGLRTLGAGFGAGTLVAGSAAKLIPALAGKGLGAAAGRVLGAAGEGAVTGGGVSAMDAANRGQDAGEVARAGAGGALMGGAVGGGAQTVGEMLTGAGRAMLASKGAAARALIEKYGGKVGLFNSGSGLPELDGVKGPVTDYDIGAAARKSGQDLIRANDARFHQEGRLPYQEELAKLEGRAPAVPVDDSDIIGSSPARRPPSPPSNVDPQMEARLRALGDAGFKVPGSRAWTPSEVANGAQGGALRVDDGPLAPSTPASQAAMAGEDARLPPAYRMVDVTPVKQKMLEVMRDKSTDPATQAFLAHQVKILDEFHTTDNGMVEMTHKDINGLKSMLQNASNPGLPPGAGSVRDVKIGQVAAVAKSIVDTGPYAEANANYAAAKNASGDFREALGMARRPAPSEAIDEGKAARFLARQGQTTTTAGIQGGDQRLADLVAQHPELARTIDAPNLLKAKADLQLGTGNHVGGLIHRPAASVLGMAAHNASAIAGRAAYWPAKGMAGVGRDALSQGINPLVAAAQQNQQAEEQRRQMELQKRLNDAQTIHTIFGKPRDESPPQ
jgi:hypothetical protein